MNDAVNHPKHYTSHSSGLECIQFTRLMNFNRGNALKYLWRKDLKGASKQDLAKAIWYLNDEIANCELPIYYEKDDDVLFNLLSLLDKKEAALFDDIIYGTHAELEAAIDKAMEWAV